MIFNKKYTPRNEELKRMFSKFRAEHYSMYDTYFKNKWILRKWFKEHYNNYKPTLDQIKNFDVSSLTFTELAYPSRKNVAIFSLVNQAPLKLSIK